MAAVCPGEDCQHDGNLRAKKVIETLHHTFKSIDINPERIQLVQIHAGDKTLFQAKIDTFVDTLNKLDPHTIRERWYES